MSLDWAIGPLPVCTVRGQLWRLPQATLAGATWPGLRNRRDLQDSVTLSEGAGFWLCPCAGPAEYRVYYCRWCLDMALSRPVTALDNERFTVQSVMLHYAMPVVLVRQPGPRGAGERQEMGEPRGPAQGSV